MKKLAGIVASWGAAIAFTAVCAYEAQGGGVGFAVMVTYNLWNERLQHLIEKQYLRVYNARRSPPAVYIQPASASLLTGCIAALAYTAAVMAVQSWR